MKISYDSEVDAFYIRLLDGNYECHTLRLSKEIALNNGEDEQLVGIEILDTWQVLGNPNVILENLLYTAVENV